MVLGVHISGAGKASLALVAAHDLGCNTMQIFSRNPRQWRRDKPLAPEEIHAFRANKQKFKISPVFVHIPYLINLASPEPRLYHASIEAYIEDIQDAQELGVDFIVTHMGSHKETSEEEGLKRLVDALNTIIEKTAKCRVGILLENTAGAGSWLGYTFAHQRKVFQGVKRKERLGLCFDTAHAYVAGNNIATKEGFEKVIAEIDTQVGLEHLHLIHLNDALGKLGSHHDRHENIGKGAIGMEGMRRIINHPAFADKAFVLETPTRKDGDDLKNLKTVRNLHKD
ncbi:MAG: deoxyribonuclease IV [Candidatus Omnitrophica bacterium]|nr:deoxyribonuclease IV [Candidatus Omnitrophota bacterium]